MRTTQRLVAAVAAGAALTLTGLSSLPASADSTPVVDLRHDLADR